MSNFSDLGVDKRIVSRLGEMEIVTPTEIQEKAMPYLISEGNDFIGQAQTGTGKTAAFGIPLIQRMNAGINYVQGIILCPTRELGQQISRQIFKYTKNYKKIYTECVYGGVNIGQQITSLKRPTQILVGTPGRILELQEKKALNLKSVNTVILDEADEMLSMGFKSDIESILSRTEAGRDIWLFSATMPFGIQQLIDTYMNPEAQRVHIDKENILNRNIDHQFIKCSREEKIEVLHQFLRTREDERGVIFCNTKAISEKLTKQLKARNYNVDTIHGDLKQIERQKVMRQFKGEKLQYLVATDMAARGIDVDDLKFVIHYDVPDTLDYFTHRSGRTARAGKSGLSLCFVTEKDGIRMKKIETKLRVSFNPYREDI